MSTRSCEICLEFSGDKKSTFSAIYPEIDSRIVMESERFVALPTMGQLFEGSLLIFPRDHHETFASIDSDAQSELCAFLSGVIERTNQFGSTVSFEHGARATSGGGCGIYHAHIHVVPFPNAVLAQDFFPEAEATSKSLPDAWRALNESSDYLLFSDGDKVAYARAARMSSYPPSQFFRKRIVDFFDLQKDWDWRAAKQRESELLSTLSSYDILP